MRSVGTAAVIARATRCTTLWKARNSASLKSRTQSSACFLGETRQ
jgi:hypothetical protein